MLIGSLGRAGSGILLSTGFPNKHRIAGHVGFPLPGVEVRLYNKDEARVIDAAEEQGEIQVRGPGIFNEYWNLPDVTEAEFEEGEWFKTGDVGVRSSEYPGMYRILGRSSVDIIKVSIVVQRTPVAKRCWLRAVKQSGGEKLSALEVERALLELDYITDAAVVGVPDDEWGQIVSLTVLACSGSFESRPPGLARLERSWSRPKTSTSRSFEETCAPKLRSTKFPGPCGFTLPSQETRWERLPKRWVLGL